MNQDSLSPSGRNLGKQLALLMAALFVSLAVVTGLALIAQPAGAREPGRLARKLLVPLFALLYVLLARVSRRELAEGCGYPFGPWREGLRTYLLGFGAGAASLLLLIVALLILGAWTFGPSEDVWGTLRRCFTYFLSGIVLVILEEGVFRGLVYQRLERAGGWFGSLVVGSLLFGTSHFLKPPKGRPSEGWEGAWDASLGCIAGLGTIPEKWREWVGLTLVGLVLTVLRRRRGDILLGMGVHAGWFWVRGVDGRFLRSVKPVQKKFALLYGGGLYYNGVLGWIALGSVALLALVIRPRSSGSER